MVNLIAPYLWIVMIERVLCKDSVVIVYTVETGEKFVSLIPYN